MGYTLPNGAHINTNSLKLMPVLRSDEADFETQFGKLVKLFTGNPQP